MLFAYQDDVLSRTAIYVLVVRRHDFRYLGMCPEWRHSLPVRLGVAASAQSTGICASDGIDFAVCRRAGVVLVVRLVS